MPKPSVVFRNELGYNNSDEWVKLNAVYEADGTEKYLTFGCFVYRERTDFTITNYNMQIPGKRNYAHYFIDDFTLTSLDGIEKTELAKKEIPAVDIPKVYETGKYHIFKNIVFESGKADLLPSSFDELNELAEYLNNNPDLKATIIGHTDNVGKAEENLILSFKRAQAVSVYLEKKNIAALRLYTEGKGDNQPVVPNSTEDSRALNRRVEVLFH